MRKHLEPTSLGGSEDSMTSHRSPEPQAGPRASVALITASCSIIALVLRSLGASPEQSRGPGSQSDRCLSLRHSHSSRMSRSTGCCALTLCLSLPVFCGPHRVVREMASQQWWGGHTAEVGDLLCGPRPDRHSWALASCPSLVPLY